MARNQHAQHDTEEFGMNIPENLGDLSKQEFLSIIKALKNQGNKNPIKKTNSVKKSECVKKKLVPFDFTKYKKRHIALKFLYLGWNYSGFGVQTQPQNTIEEQLFNALLKTKLLDSKETPFKRNYDRCGRTDQGVSAFSQVISLELRTSLLEGKGVKTPENFVDDVSDTEIDYTSVLNEVLPPEIRVIAWAPVQAEFSAWFDCKKRTYKYWFPVGNLDIKKMGEAGRKLVGEHDFRSLCKMDVENGVLNYKRRIFSVDIKKLCLSEFDAYDMAELTVVGQAFLYHQIQCIVSILCLIGLGKEDPEIIHNLLDVSKFPRKPQYDMASEVPLVLFDCSYKDLEWNYDEECLKQVIKNLQSLWAEHSVKTIILRKMLSELEKLPVVTQPVITQAEYILPALEPQGCKRLLERSCDSLEERIEHDNKKARQTLQMSDLSVNVSE